MNDDENIDFDGNDDTTGAPTEGLPLGYWLRAVDALLTEEFAAAFRDEGVTRRDWMLLNTLAGAPSAGTPGGPAPKGKRLRRLEDLGWAEEQGDGTWTLTDAGREAHVRLGETVAGIRSRVSGAVSDDDFAITMTSLEAIARELGWDESTPRSGRGWRRRFGGPPAFGPDARFGFGPRFGPRAGFGFGPRHGMSRGEAWAYGRDEDDCRHGFDGHHGHRGHPGHAGHGERHPREGRGHHGDHGQGHHGLGHHGEGHGPHGDHRHGSHHGHPRHGGQGRQRAYERGFDAGYRRGREAGAA
ncbi:hypothetical protein [Microbacterium sp. HJ5]